MGWTASGLRSTHEGSSTGSGKVGGLGFTKRSEKVGGLGFTKRSGKVGSSGFTNERLRLRSKLRRWGQQGFGLMLNQTLETEVTMVVIMV